MVFRTFLASTVTNALLLSIFVLPLNCCTFATGNLVSEQEHYERALKYYTDNRHDAALKELNQAIVLNPKDSSYFHARGNVNYELHDYAKAAEDYSTAITLNPDDASAYGNRGWSYRRLGRDELAFLDWRTCNRLLCLPPPKPVPKGKNTSTRTSRSVSLGRRLLNSTP